MPLLTDVQQWVPGSLKLGTSDMLPDTSIVFPEAVIHPQFSDPNVLVPVEEERWLVFIYFLLNSQHTTFMQTAASDVPPGYSSRRGYLTDQTPDGLSVQFVVTIPLETALLFGQLPTQS